MLTTSRRPTTLLVAALLAVLVAACSSGGAAGPSPSAVPTQGDDRPSPSDGQVPIATPSGGEAGSVPDAILGEAIAMAAQEVGVDASQVTVVSTESITWNNGALGCPKPGEMYTQALVPGYRIVLEAGGRQLDYHASEGGAIKLCEGLLGS